MLFIWNAAATLLVGMRFAAGLDTSSNAVRRQPSESRTAEILSAESVHLVRRTRNAIVGVGTSGRATGAISLDGCKTQHPAHRSDVLRMTPREVMDCYAQWHDATLAAWRQEEFEKCEGRRARIHMADHGLGDSGGAFIADFSRALVGGDMIFWHFPAAQATVWQLAMVAPFDWDLKANAHLFCLGDAALRELAKSPPGHVVGKCPNCAYPQDIQTPSSFGGTRKDMWEFLYRPIEGVRQMVQDVLQQVKGGERLIGVHFRAQWFGSHHSCGCMDSKEAAQCLSNIGGVLQQRGLRDFAARPGLRYFVASDEFAGLDAFRETFRDRLVTLPECFNGTCPLEHSLNVSAAGAKRILAEFLILSNASAVLGSCGSTFTETVMMVSGLPKEALIKTGSEESSACATNHGNYDFSSFNFKRFAKRTWSQACGCYGSEESTKITEHNAIRGPCGRNGLAESDETKPAWVPQQPAAAA